MCISVITMPGGVLRYIFQLPAVVEHFNHHNTVGDPVSFIEFIHEHLFEQYHPDYEKNHPDHEKLPFDSHAHAPHVVTYIPHYYTVDLNCNYILLQHSQPPLRKWLVGTEILSNIWQPPRMS